MSANDAQRQEDAANGDGDSGFRASSGEHGLMLVSHLWSLKEIWFEIFQCFP